MWFRMLGRPVCMLAVVLAISAAGSAPSSAEDAVEKPNAIGLNSDWNTDVNGSTTVTGVTLDDTGLALVGDINTYFNSMDDLQGTFRQTDSQNQKQKGKFYIQRPGKFRFAYSAPSQLIILSDGKLLSYEDHDLQNVDRYPIESTPFKILLQPNVDLLRDAHVTDLKNEADVVSVTLSDKAEESSGQMKLAFTRTETGLELKEWVITSPDGSDTRVEVANLVSGQQVDPKLFEGSNIGMEFNNSKN